MKKQVTAFVEDVRRRGDVALVEYTRRVDGVSVDIPSLRLSKDSLREAASKVNREVLAALREAIRRVRIFHEQEYERERSWEIQQPNDVVLGQRITPIENVGVYVPGGSASYPSSVVMNVVPAQIAKVNKIIVVTPPRTFQENPAVAAALVELNVSEVYAVGGAQAVAALAYGTQTIPRVDKIVGPGNSYVTAAKKAVFGAVGIDSLAGPSEVAVIADETAPAALVASDLLAQAEHGEDASAICITTSKDLASEILNELAMQIRLLSRSALIEKSLTDFGAIFVVGDIDEACALANEIAPEHLEIMARDDEAIASRIKHAGAIFFGKYSPEAVGDYFAGPNHVLPTGGSARFASGLGVRDFLKRTNTIRFSATELNQTAGMIAALARAEGLDAHARSALIRLPAAKGN